MINRVTKDQTTKKKKAVYPGSFDPITLGHVDIINRISKLYDEVIILIALSDEKKSLFNFEERKDLIKRSLKGLDNVKIDYCSNLTVEYVAQVGAQVIVRGLRAVVDFEYELSMANINKKLKPEVETVLVFASPEFYFISSRAVKEVATRKGCLKGLVPEEVIKPLLTKLAILRKMRKKTEKIGQNKIS